MSRVTATAASTTAMMTPSRMWPSAARTIAVTAAVSSPTSAVRATSPGYRKECVAGQVR